MSSTVDVNALLIGAVDEGNLGANSLNILNGIDDIGNRIQAGLGTPADAISASEVILVRLLVDDSPSMAGDAYQATIAGYNEVIDALLNSKQKSGILFAADLLNGGCLCPYTPLDQATRLSTSNYPLIGMTPLYDGSLVLLGTVTTKTQEFSDNGVPVRSISLIMTDGFNNQGRGTASQVETLVTDLLRQENHIVASMGIANDPAGQKNFRDVFQKMGIPAKWILTPQNNASEIRKAFSVFSNSAVRASQNAANFSQTSVGGFGSP